MKYVDGFVVAVPAENKEAYIAMAAKAAPLFKEFGALRVVECGQMMSRRQIDRFSHGCESAGS
jgi:uncharacterized protein YbaA (DUF1428 family)